MGNDKYEEHPLDSWLDAESEDNFVTEIRDRFATIVDENASGSLRVWTNRDFTSIYGVFDLT